MFLLSEPGRTSETLGPVFEWHTRGVNLQPRLSDRDVEPCRRDQHRGPGVDHPILRLQFAGNAGQGVLERHAGQEIFARAASEIGSPVKAGLLCPALT